MFVFEELVMNVDAKADHFRVKQLADGRRYFSVVDHGHCLHAWRGDLQDPTSVENQTALGQPASIANEYKISSYAELVPWIEQIKKLDPASHSKVLEECLSSMGHLRPSDQGVNTFLDDHHRHAQIITTILSVRSRNIEAIVKQKCQQLALAVPEISTSSVGIGVN